MIRTSSLVTLVVIGGTLGIAAWYWAGQNSARSLHLDQGSAYAAKSLEAIGTVPDELGESSGVAVSRTQPGVLWSHNDSGDGPQIYAIDASGRLRATVTLPSARPHDWEDMAGGPCPPYEDVFAGADACLYVGDIGDNDRQRETLTIQVVAEPRLDPTHGPVIEGVNRSFRFQYPDEPHDSEALAVLPDGAVTIVTKGRAGRIDFYGLPAAAIARAMETREILTAVHQGDSGLEPDAGIGRYVTGAALSPDGRTLAVRTYNEVFFFERVSTDGETRWRDLERPCFLGYVEPLGEAIDYLDERTLVLTSEKGLLRPGPIHRLQC